MTAVECPVCQDSFSVGDPQRQLVYCDNIECPVYRFDGLGREVAQ